MNPLHRITIIPGAVRLAFALLITHAIVVGATQSNATPVKAVINHSVAPWDDAAYEILVPMQNVVSGSNPYVRIDIWCNPEFQKAKSFHFSKNGDNKEGGRAFFQSVLDKSMPVTLTGTVSFKTLQPGHPVFGTFEFVDPDGKKFKADIEATWGNKPFPYIR